MPTPRPVSSLVVTRILKNPGKQSPFRSFATHRELGFRQTPPSRYSSSLFGTLFWPAAFAGGVVTLSFVVAPYANNLLENYRIPGLTRNQSVVATLVAANIFVFGLWRVPGAQRFLAKYFLLNPARPVASSLLFSTFSHQSFNHLLVNMIALWSFAQPLVGILSPGYFLAMYMSAGVTASMGSLLWTLLAKKGMTGVSLGASGAIYSLLSILTLLAPESKLVLFFLPFLQVKAMYAVPSILALDVVGLFGVFNKWILLDHAAHVCY